MDVSVLRIPQTVLCALAFQPLHYSVFLPGPPRGVDVFLDVWMASSTDLLIFLPRKNIYNLLGSPNLRINTVNSSLRI